MSHHNHHLLSSMLFFGIILSQKRFLEKDQDFVKKEERSDSETSVVDRVVSCFCGFSFNFFLNKTICGLSFVQLQPFYPTSQDRYVSGDHEFVKRELHSDSGTGNCVSCFLLVFKNKCITYLLRF